MTEQGDDLSRAVARHDCFRCESRHLSYVPLMNLRIVGIVSEDFGKVAPNHFDQCHRGKMKVHGYTKVEQLALVCGTIFDRKKGRVVVAHLEKICDFIIINIALHYSSLC